MNCFGCKKYNDKVGILLAQLGTPEAPTPEALRPYLKQFLSDSRVIEANRLLWWFILNFIVLTTRPKRSARLYKRIWTEEGSPLLVITKKQTIKLEEYLKGVSQGLEVAYGMRYGEPSIESAIDNLIEKGCTKILIFPMYPQYSATTTASIYDSVFKHVLKRRWVPTIKVAAPYYNHPAYIEALTSTIEESYNRIPNRPERLVLSYHGIPHKYVQKGDPYCCMCVETTGALLERISIPRTEIIHTYQSRFGKDPWLEPYTDVTIEKLANEGVKRIAVAAPGFTADCLETLDELGNEGRELFVEHGGAEFTLIPCLNDQPAWINALGQIVREELGNWLDQRISGKCQGCPMDSLK